MRPKMKELLEHLKTNNYCTEDVITIIGSMRAYGRARIEFNNSTTPESVALARWSLDDAREEWRKTVRTYKLPIVEVDYLF